MTFPRLRRIKLTALLVGAAGLGACVAPILTVPPPGAAEIGFSIYSAAGDGGTVAGDGGTAASDAGMASGGEKLWIAKGGPLPPAALATYYLRQPSAAERGHRDRQRRRLVHVTADMEGTDGDPIQIYYVTPAGDYSESICVLLSAGSSPLEACPE